MEKNPERRLMADNTHCRRFHKADFQHELSGESG
jgi:hypothetical protein